MLLKISLTLALSILAGPAWAASLASSRTEEPIHTHKTLLFDGVYAPVFGEVRYLSSPSHKQDDNFESYGMRSGFQTLRLPGVAATVGFAAQSSADTRLLAFWGPTADIIAFPEARFHLGIGGTFAKGMLQRRDQGLSDDTGLVAAAPASSWERYNVKVSEVTIYGAFGLISDVQLIAGMSKLSVFDESAERYMSAAENSDPSGISYTVGIRASTL